MVKTALVEFFDVLVVEGVKDLAAVFAGTHEAHLAQAAQVVGGGGFGEADSGGEGTDVHFAMGEGGDDADAAGIAEGAE